MNQPKLEPRPHADNTRLIPLTQGQFAIVDAADFEWLSRWNWYAWWNSHTHSFYAIREERGTAIRMHRFILGLHRGNRREGDHRNNNTLDNTRKNLRIATRLQNAKNRRANRNTKSGFKGAVQHSKHSWRAIIKVNRRTYVLGSFPTPEEAHAAYCEAAIRLHGEFANTG